MNENNTLQIAVIGGGAAGLMAAGTAASLGAEVTLFEHKDRPGRKLSITGKGRCNVTNDCAVEEFLTHVPNNPRFLYAALRSLSPADTQTFFEGLGVPLKVERGRRVFPVSDKARDIVDALVAYCRAVRFVYERVHAVKVNEDGGFTVCAERERRFDRVIMATGGRSYSATGSDGSGHRMARRLSHTVTPLCPSLVPLESSSPVCAELQGLSLKNVSIRLCEGDKVHFTDFGEMLFTHFGVSGPLVLSASAHVAGRDISSMTLFIDLKPALDEKTLDARLLSDFSERKNKDLANALGDLLPAKLQGPFLRLSGIAPHKKVNAITKGERKQIVDLLKAFPVPLAGFRPIEEAIITRGGVDVKQIKPGTMESKLHPGLYFAGELLDVDAYTGGYNLQIAFSTGYLAATHAAQSKE